MQTISAIAAFFADPTIPRLLLAVLFGAVIGIERQWRQRTAGLRTNTLVCLGAAAFVDLAGTISGAGGATRVVAYVVSGVGFLGAGTIMKEGINVRGLNTAATLWCSAAVGASAAAGKSLAAVSTCVLVVAVNLFLRRIVAFVDRRTLAAPESDVGYTLRLLCAPRDEAHIRALLVHGIGEAGLSLRELESMNTDRPDTVEVEAQVVAGLRNDAALERIAGRLSLEPSVTGVQWRSVATNGDGG
jgi:putative Mg2+ transporter-C (MgtC) family protein